MAQLNLVGQTLGTFEILSELGRGGMGAVYRARQTTLHRIVALKVLLPELSADTNYVARFHREAQNAANLEHPNIIPIYEIGEARNLHYIAMRFIEGCTLREVMEQERGMSIWRAIELLSPVASALDHAHQHRVIHRDIKPSNVMMARDGTIYLADFGLARGLETTTGLTRTGMVMGTPDYMAPEQAQGLPDIGPPADIYALGIVLYQMLTGSLPFESPTPMGMIAARILQAPRPPGLFRADLPPAVEEVIMRALSREPAARPASAGQLLSEVRRAVEYAPVSSPPTLKSYDYAPTPPPPTPPPPSPTPRAYDYAYAPPQPAPAPTPSPTPAAPPEKKHRGWCIGLGVVGALLLLAVAGVSAGLLFVLSDDTASSPSAPTEMAVSPTTPSSATTERPGPLSASPAAATPAGDPEIARLLQEGEEALQRRGGMDDAIVAYQQVLDYDADHVTALSQLAFIHSLRFQHEQTEELARAAIDADPQAAFAYVVLADTLDDRRETFDSAWDAINQAINLDPDLSFAYAIRAEMQANRAYDTGDQQMLQQAIADAERAIELAASEDNLMKALSHSARGTVYRYEYWITQDPTRLTLAVEEFNKAIGLQNQIAYFASSLGYFYNDQADYDLEHGREEEAAQKFDLAVQKFQEALSIDPSYAYAYNGLGWNSFSRGAYDQAFEAFDQATEIDPSNVDALLGKNLVYRFQDPPDYEGAIDVLNQAAAIAPRNDEVFEWMGWTYLNQEEMEAAAEQFRQALGLNPDSTDAHRGLGWATYRQHSYDESETHFRRSIELNPTNYEPYLGLGYVLEETDRPSEARSMFEQTLELDPGNENALLGLERLDEAEGK